MSEQAKTQVRLAVNLSRGTWAKGSSFLEAMARLEKESEISSEDKVCLRVVEAADESKVRVGPMGNLQYMPGDSVIGEGRSHVKLADWWKEGITIEHIASR